MTGRKSDSIWNYFEKSIALPGRKGCRAVCKKCGKSMEGQVARMKKHYDKCLSITSGAGNLKPTSHKYVFRTFPVFKLGRFNYTVAYKM